MTLNDQQRSALWADELARQRAVARRDEAVRAPALVDGDDMPIEWLICHCTGDPDDTLCHLHRGEGGTP